MEKDEYTLTTELANRVLDRVSGDPDDDFAMLARQFLRAVEREERLKAAIDWMLIINSEKNPHLGRPRTSDKSCLFCMGYLAMHYNAYGERIETSDYKQWAQERRAELEAKK
jgi:hypothetical protein